MIFIPPMEIATRIMTLIDNAKTELILVSPYISIDNWAKLKKCLQRAVDRGVEITIYARENATQNLETIKSFNVNLYLVKDLHAKIYINDRYAIASSQNLIQYSDDNSIDFGYSTETEEERQQLLGLISQYLIVSKPFKREFREEIKSFEKKEVSISITTEVITEFDMQKIYNTFCNRHNQVRINNDATYVYCTKLFPFGDVMFREGLEIRFNFQHKGYDAIVKILENLNLKNNHFKYEKKLVMNKTHPSSFIFIPKNVTDVQKLIYDYIFIINRILEKTGNSFNTLTVTELSFNKEFITAISQNFKKDFPRSNFKVNPNYLFSNDLISFAAVLIDKEYKLKIEMERMDYKMIVAILEKMNFKYNYSYDTDIYQEYDSRIYFSIIPQKCDNLQLLISDYIAITKEILIKTEKVILETTIGTIESN